MIPLFLSLIVLTSPMPKQENSQETPKVEDKLILTAREWKQRLTPEQYKVLRKGKTEPAFSGTYCDLKEKGTYVCAGCALPLFSSEPKYDSGSGWPSFFEPINPNNIMTKNDYLLLHKRVEVLCNRCYSHLGHLFEDGPPPTGKRYRINSLSLRFLSEKN
jgi:peptide-methionine (R)-S-oxide reductase